MSSWPMEGNAAYLRGLTLVVDTVLGLLLWNSFFAAVAATVSDVYTSSRSSLIFLPLVPGVLSISLLRDPDARVARILARLVRSCNPTVSMPADLSGCFGVPRGDRAS